MRTQVITRNFRSRRTFIGGSDARIIMGPDEAALIRLWKEKRGEVEPEDLTDNLVVQLRDKEHCRFVATLPCVVCGRMPSEAHHIRFAQPRALGRKVSDECTVPVCRLHHRELHRYGDEASWWAAVSIDPVPIALELWGR
jgi:hypothetical protein